MEGKKLSNSTLINGVALGFSIAFLISSLAAGIYTRDLHNIFHGWYLIMTSPSPLVTDYLEIGGLPSAMLNAGACGMACWLFMVGLKGESRPSTLAGYFLVVAHCFYGLNFLTMWPCFLAPFLYLHLKKLDYKATCMSACSRTSFGPFIGELLFRYTQDTFVFGHPTLTISGVLLTLAFSLMLGFIVPAILPGAHAWHKGYNLYNGGLAFGLFGFFLFNFFYNTMGIDPSSKPTRFNPVYEQFGHSFQLYANCFFLIIFVICIVTGFFLNSKSFRGYEELTRDTGHQSDFATKYGMPLCLINIGTVGLFFLFYLDIIMIYTEGAGFTGATIGVILAALTFTCMGQHPKNIWPILAGYQLLYLFTLAICYLNDREISWTITTQGYINGVAFATGLCPISGRYGRRAGIVAGFMCASMCTATSALHGGLVLYNGGFTSGITALILLPILEHYIPKTRDFMNNKKLNKEEMIAIVETFKTHD